MTPDETMLPMVSHHHLLNVLQIGKLLTGQTTTCPKCKENHLLGTIHRDEHPVLVTIQCNSYQCDFYDSVTIVGHRPGYLELRREERRQRLAEEG